MILITGDRGSGRTTTIINDAIKLAQQGHQVIIVTPTALMVSIIKSKLDAKYDDMIDVLSAYEYNELINGRGKCIRNKFDILIDDFDYFLKTIFKNNIAEISVDKRNVEVIEIARNDLKD